jgi:hypothetical protein
MNLVEHIEDQLSSGLINRLSSLIGASEEVVRSAAGAAVPALLSALSSVTSSGSGAQKLLSALGQLGGGTAESLVHKLSNQPGSVLEQGTSLLNSLFGGSTVSAIVNALSRFAGMAPGVSQKLLGYLTPMVLGAIAGRFAGKSVTTQALSSLFAEQRSNIANALPSGFSLGDVPGLAATGSAVRTAARAAEATGSSAMRWLLPLLGLAALGLLLWWLIPSATPPGPGAPTPDVSRAPAPVATKVRAPEAPEVSIPDATRLSTELTDTFKNLTETLTGVKDVPSAEAALPKLQDLSGKLDVAKAAMQKLADAGKATIKSLVQSSQVKLKELVDKVLAIPGVGEKIRAVVDPIMAKLTDLAG